MGNDKSKLSYNVPPISPSARPIDLNKYKGQWYEYMRTDNNFQDEHDINTKAYYGLVYDETEQSHYVSIKNVTTRNGKRKEWNSVGHPLNKENTQLEIQTFLFFTGQYWIIDFGLSLDETQYEWILVSTPQRKSAWLLTRSKECFTEFFKQEMCEVLVKYHFDPRAFRLTYHEP